MGNPAGMAKKLKEKRFKKHMLQLARKDAAAEAAATTPAKPEAAKK